MIECPTHGEAYATYVCRHLASDPLQQWFCDYPSEENPWPDSWCSVCDQAFQQEGEWNEKNEQTLDVTLICHCCYEQFKGSSVAPLMEARCEAWEPFLSDAISELQAKQDYLTKAFGLSRHERWDWDQETGEIVFSNAHTPTVIARVQFVGSVSTVTDTWLWSWANPSFVPNVVKEMLTVRAFGEAEHFACLTVPKWPAEEADGWEMTAVAAKVLGAEGAYRTPGDSGFSFMLLKDIRRAQ
jgi:hypothetical protein